MKKKWFVLLFVLLMCTSGLAITAEAKTSADFTDLKDLDQATKAKFDSLISAGIFDGVSDTTFGLKDEMNRAQFAKVAALITGIEVNKDLKTSSFSDVTGDDAANGYALPYIEALKTAGITDGYGEGTYNPAGKVTREQLATFLARITGKNETAKALTGTDATVSDWAQGYVALALELKLLPNGTADGTFGGKINATRDLLVTGTYESAQYIPTSPIYVAPAPVAPAPVAPTPVKLKEPIANPSSGTIKSGTEVSLSALNGASIRYTTDGSIPTSTNGFIYSAPIVVDKDMTIKTIAVLAGMNDSTIAEFSYKIALPAMTNLTSNLTSVTLTAVGATQSLVITAEFDNNTSLNVTAGALYESDDVKVARVDDDGFITAVANGTTNITITYGGITKKVPVLVTVSRELESIYAFVASNPLRVGLSSNIIVNAYFFDESTNVQSDEEVTAVARIEIEDPDLAALDADFNITALKAGSTRIKVTFLSKEFFINLNILE